MAEKLALLICISEFADYRLNILAAPEKDVAHLRDVLLDPGLAGFDKVNICINSSLEEVRSSILNLLVGRSSDDLVLFYYSGHGICDSHGELYFALPSTDSMDPSPDSLAASYVSDSMNDNRSSRQVIILDCRYSGISMLGESAVSKDANVHAINAETFGRQGHGPIVLSASSGSESSFEEDGKSIFTRTIVDGLTYSSVAPEKEAVSIEDLHHFLVRSANNPDARMLPQYLADKQTEPLIISRNPVPAPQASGAPERLQEAGSAEASPKQYSHSKRIIGFRAYPLLVIVALVTIIFFGIVYQS